ncbi:MAG: hypothetical protein ACOCX2_07445 [Armatimonadota bacterium]
MHTSNVTRSGLIAALVLLTEKMARSWHPDWENLSTTERQTALSEARASHEALARELHAEFFRGKVWVSKTEISDREDGFAWAHFATESSGTFGLVLRWDGTVWKFANTGYAGGLSQ